MSIRKCAWLSFSSMLIIYGGFMLYFCMANPTNTGNIIYAAEKDFIGKAEPNKKIINISGKDDLNIKATNQPALSEDKVVKIESQLGGRENYENLDRYKGFLEFYMGQIINFYQIIITLLLGVIGVLLVISFLYLRFTSRLQADEVVNEALNLKSFEKRLKDMIEKEVDSNDLSTQMADLASKVDRLDKIMDAKDDDEITEPPK